MWKRASNGWDFDWHGYDFVALTYVHYSHTLESKQNKRTTRWTEQALSWLEAHVDLRNFRNIYNFNSVNLYNFICSHLVFAYVHERSHSVVLYSAFKFLWRIQRLLFPCLYYIRMMLSYVLRIFYMHDI